MARVQISTSSSDKNAQVAGSGGFVAGDDGTLNNAVHGSSGGFGVVGTDGSDRTTGNFEVLDALPGWYLRDLPVERHLRRNVDAVGETIASRIESANGYGDIDDKGFIRNLVLRHGTSGASNLHMNDLVNLVSSESDSEARTIEVGDSIIIRFTYAVISRIHQNNAGIVLLDAKLHRGTEFVTADNDVAIRFAKGTIVNSFSEADTDALGNSASTHKLVQPIPS